jgi:hypothetical protein
MASKYKGPVHEAVRSGLKSLGVNIGGSKTVSVRKQPTVPKTDKTYRTNPFFEQMKRRNAGATAEGAEETVRNSRLVSTLPKAPKPKAKAPAKARTTKVSAKSRKRY